MSTRYENHQRAAELHDIAAHAHRAAAQHGQQDHLTGQEQSRHALEHSQNAYLLTQQVRQQVSTGHGVVSFGHADTAILAYGLWQARGCPQGSPDEDWFRASAKLRSR